VIAAVGLTPTTAPVRDVAALARSPLDVNCQRGEWQDGYMSIGLLGRHSAALWMTVSFVVATALAAVVFEAVDPHDRVAVALRVLPDGRLCCSGSPARLARWRLCGVRRSQVWPVTVVNLALHLRQRNLCMLDSSLSHT
jgi:hypothetical protein